MADQTDHDNPFKPSDLGSAQLPLSPWPRIGRIIGVTICGVTAVYGICYLLLFGLLTVMLLQGNDPKDRAARLMSPPIIAGGLFGLISSLIGIWAGVAWMKSDWTLAWSRTILCGIMLAIAIYVVSGTQ